MPTLTDKGYVGAGIGIQVPTKGHHLHSDHQTRNAIISALRAPAERANALLKRSWKALEHVTLDPPSTRGESAPSPPQHSSYFTFSGQSGEKTPVLKNRTLGRAAPARKGVFVASPR